MAKHSDVEEMTREGYEKLKEELTLLRTEKRMEISRKLEEARGFGDLSENAEYHAAKEEQEKLEGRISKLEFKISHAKVIEVEDIDTNHAAVGATITFKDIDKKSTHSYTLVSSMESDVKGSKISAESPVGKAIMGHSIGDEVTVRVPKGIRRIKITDITVMRP
ncbi:transcription elongation factor GreA [Synergistales bacterium]|nr:transcription elongation factor GreA [Synergistales bacterium]GHV52554.1 transcription elongation factor GreA [Synergistales bacterium]